MTPAGRESEPTASEAVAVYQSADRQACRVRALVLQSASIPHRIRTTPSDVIVEVAFGDAERATAEIAAFEAENQESSEAASTLQEHGDGITGVCCYAIIISGIHYFRLQLPDDWLSAGRMNAGAVCSGDWWRTVTALTLHVDMYHLLGNLVYGSLFGLFAGRLFGSGVAWFIILIAGALGNGLNAWIQPPAHNAVGASTAIFSCLGILAASAWALRYATELHWARRWAPVLAGVVLLSFTGLGGERTDVLAHITGFVVGLVAGALCARIARLPIIGIAAQLACGTCTALAIIAAWWAAAAAR